MNKPLGNIIIITTSHQLTIEHLWSHPVRVSDHSVALLSVTTSEHPLLVWRLLRRRLNFVLHDKPGQSEVGDDHGVVLLKRAGLDPSCQARHPFFSSWMCLVATYQFNQAVVRVEVSVDDAHRMKVSLKQRWKVMGTTFTAVSEDIFIRPSPPLKVLHHEVLFYSLLWKSPPKMELKTWEQVLFVVTVGQLDRVLCPLSGSPLLMSLTIELITDWFFNSARDDSSSHKVAGL